MHDAALRPLYFMTPDHRASIQWGDEQNPREFVGRLSSWQTTNGILAGLAQGDPDSGPYIQQHVFDLAAEYGISGYRTSEPWARSSSCSIRAAKASYDKLPRGCALQDKACSSPVTAGLSRVRSCLFTCLPSRHPSITGQLFGGFQIYRKGEWVITHPLSLGRPCAPMGRHMLLGSFSSMSECTGHCQGGGRQEASRYISGTTGGQAVREALPPPHVLLNGRAAWSVCPQTTRSDTLVVHDERTPRIEGPSAV